MITTTIDVSAIADLGKRFVTLAQSSQLLKEVAENVRTLQRVRIHEDGLKADGSLIGQYSKGYLKLRLEKGKPSDRVILFWEGDLANQYQVVPLSDTEYGLGWYNPTFGIIAETMEEGGKPTTVKAHTRTVNGKSIQVGSYSRKGWDGFGKIYDLTDTELEEVRLTVQDFINRTFS